MRKGAVFEEGRREKCSVMSRLCMRTRLVIVRVNQIRLIAAATYKGEGECCRDFSACHDERAGVKGSFVVVIFPRGTTAI